MALPQLTPEQRAANLAKAAEARTARAALRADLKSGAISFADVLARADDDPVVGKTKVAFLLESLPRFGKVRVTELMGELQILQTRRIAGLSESKRAELLERLSPS